MKELVDDHEHLEAEFEELKATDQELKTLLRLKGTD